MDIFSHALLGAAVVNNKELLLPAFLFGAGPDLISGIPVWTATIYRLRKEKKSWREIRRFFCDPHNWQSAPAWTHTFYIYLHSLLFAILLSWFIYYFYPPWLILMRAWFLHIILDIPTHKDWFAHKPFYPFSNRNFGLFNWFETPLLYLGVLISAVIFGLVYF
ncbi:hypothetical protein HYV91_03545 [Candidatus Wolfebacteria bacterium]|nr:hypothetical protein [Candidatus Wolfebacteria bacterium]